MDKNTNVLNIATEYTASQSVYEVPPVAKQITDLLNSKGFTATYSLVGEESAKITFSGTLAEKSITATIEIKKYSNTLLISLTAK